MVTWSGLLGHNEIKIQKSKRWEQEQNSNLTCKIEAFWYKAENDTSGAVIKRKIGNQAKSKIPDAEQRP